MIDDDDDIDVDDEKRGKRLARKQKPSDTSVHADILTEDSERAAAVRAVDEAVADGMDRDMAVMLYGYYSDAGELDHPDEDEDEE